MKKLILLLCIITKLTPSGTILELIKPYRIIENDLVNTLVMSASIFSLYSIKNQIIQSLEPVEGQDTNNNKEKSIFILKNLLKSILSPVFLAPIIINIQHKKEIVPFKFLLKGFLINTSLTVTENIIKNKIPKLPESEDDSENIKKIKKGISNLIAISITALIIRKIIFSNNLNLISKELQFSNNTGEFLMYLFNPKDPQDIGPFFRFIFKILEDKCIKNDTYI